MDVETRLARVEADQQIRQLISRYSFALDERLPDELSALFAEDATMRSGDGAMNSDGREAILKMFYGRLDLLGPGSHYMHDVQIDFVSETEATGKVSAHVEIMRKGTMMVGAMRYRDRYCKTADGWRFQAREVGFLYYVPIDRYFDILRQRDRNLAYDEPRPADFPEKLASWSA
jgi:hypothetical protein